MAMPFNSIAGKVMRHSDAICHGKCSSMGRSLFRKPLPPNIQYYTIAPPIGRFGTWVFRWTAMLVFQGLKMGFLGPTWLELSIFLRLYEGWSHLSRPLPVPPVNPSSWQVLRVIAPATFDIGATGLCCSLVFLDFWGARWRTRIPRGNSSQTTIVGGPGSWYHPEKIRIDIIYQ